MLSGLLFSASKRVTVRTHCPVPPAENLGTEKVKGGARQPDLRNLQLR